jgi:hypothetical protein
MGNNSDGKLLRPMYIMPTDEEVTRINEGVATYEEVAAMFSRSRPAEYQQAFRDSPEVTVVMTVDWTKPLHVGLSKRASRV